MIRRPPRSTRTEHSFPTRRSSDLILVAEQYVLDLGGIDILAARDDHVLHSAANPQIAVGVDRAGVAGMIPAVSVDRRLIGSPPIALHDAVRSHHDLPDRVGAERMVLFVRSE